MKNERDPDRLALILKGGTSSKVPELRDFFLCIEKVGSGS